MGRQERHQVDEQHLLHQINEKMQRLIDAHLDSKTLFREFDARFN
jgi:hypothetical protein